MDIPRVYVDTCVLKFSATELHRFRPRLQTLEWGGHRMQVTVHDPVTINRNDRLAPGDLLEQTKLLQQLAELGKAGRVTFVQSLETIVESWGIPHMDSAGGRFYGAPIEQIAPPIAYGRVIAGWRPLGVTDWQYDFLSRVSHPRFTELQKITGAYQGQRPLHRNQLIDAFALWCAEHAGCDYFLTLDFKLIRVIEKSKKKSLVQVVRPSDLLARVQALPI